MRLVRIELLLNYIWATFLSSIMVFSMVIVIIETFKGFWTRAGSIFAETAIFNGGCLPTNFISSFTIWPIEIDLE